MREEWGVLWTCEMARTATCGRYEHDCARVLVRNRLLLQTERLT